jgi:DDE superfamily endonuclease
LFATIFIVFGKVNFSNLSRYSNLTERTYRRQFGEAFDYQRFNSKLIEETISATSRAIGAIDCSFIRKSGKQTYGVDYYYNGSASKSEKGLEISVIAVVDVDGHQGYTLSVQQTAAKQPMPITAKPLAQDKAKPKVKKLLGKQGKKAAKQGKQRRSIDLKEATRVDAYVEHLKNTQPYLPASVKHIVADGFYSKGKFVNGVVGLGLNMVGKLRVDANLCHIFTGEQKRRGARRKYGGKVDLTDVSCFTLVQDLEPNLKLYTAVVWHVSLKRQVRIAYISDTRQSGKVGHVILFSTDLDLNAYDIYCFYKLRFQIEFIFRDAKQFTGLNDCQARSEYKLDFHFNASLTALNLAKFDALQQHSSDHPFVFSMATYKRRALMDHLLDQFISMLGLNHTLIKSHPNYQKLRSYGALLP